ncbi:HK97-gp10 family putative phage morphogenesis protein [Aestuariibius sp. 2305UL40-4]|uniref:HK97-gp10 family putative phage morphogenesis protein n=1 Tax=Aestuariibius violaceus TaxID=3234132 RepID=UPI00345E2C91
MVQGLKKFERRWKAIPQRVRIELRSMMEKTADAIVEDMYDFAPQDTGDLAGSIAWTWGDAPAGTMTLGTVAGGDDPDLRITIYAGGDDQFYARFQEFGTVHMPANPFFYPTWRVWRRRVRTRMRAAIRRGTRAA